ncbi:MAG TPA: hypothetical protein VG164_04670 [Trebonia sp.]|nr:hypothetical protein [Trebonia sp.]
MGYRGEDVSRGPADPRRQPWLQGRHQEDRGAAGSTGGYPEADGYPADGGHPEAGGYSQPAGYPQSGYGLPRDGYQQSGYQQGEHQQGGYAQSGGYPQAGGYSQAGNYPQAGGYQDPDGYAGPGSYPREGGYGAYRGPQGHAGPDQRGAGSAAGTAAGYADNDWYGGRGGSGFADTSTDMPAYTGAHGAPPAPPPPGAEPLDGLVYTGQQEVLDESQYEPYPGYENVDEQSPGNSYGGSGGYPVQPGYDDYAEPGSPAEPAAEPDFGTTTIIDGYRGDFDRQDPYHERYGDEQPADDGAAAPAGGDGGKARRARPAAKSARSRGRRRILVCAVAGLCLIVAAFAVYTFFIKPKNAASDSSQATGPLPSPGSTSAATAACVKQFGQYCHIEFRTDDPAPLTIAELFPPAFMNETDHTSFQRVGTRLDKTCSDAVIGQDLVSALQTGKCTQAARASYVSGSGSDQMMGTIGVINLITTNQAHYAGKVVNGNDFVAPLSTSKGIASKLGQGTGVVESQFKGHYLILTWAEFSTLKAPANKTQQKQLEQFESDLVADTANVDLSQRMVTGKAPATS